MDGGADRSTVLRCYLRESIALVEGVVGLRKTEVVYLDGLRRCYGDVEFATLEWVWWFSNHRLLETPAYVATAE